MVLVLWQVGRQIYRQTQRLEQVLRRDANMPEKGSENLQIECCSDLLIKVTDKRSLVLHIKLQISVLQIYT
jgi:hypothetical protein